MSEKLSRREFLKGGATAGGVLLAELAVPQNVRAELEELIGPFSFFEERFEDSLQRVKEHVFTSPFECMWAYVKKGRTQGLLDIQNPIATGGFGMKAAKSINLLPIFRDKEVTEIDFIHTHPAELYKDPYFRSRVPRDAHVRTLKERRSDFPLIPSGQDIVAVMLQKLAAEERGFGQAIKNIVIEPSGAWSYDANPRHQKIAHFFGDIKISAPTLKKNKELLDTLSQDMRNRQSRIYRDGGINPKNLKELKVWAEEEWGVTLSYEKF